MADDGDALKALRRLAFVAHVRGHERVGRERGKRPRRLAPVAIVEIRHAHRARAHPIEGRDRHGGVGIGDRQAADQDRIHESEHRGVDADAKRERDRGDKGEPLVFQEQPRGKSDIFPKTHGIPSCEQACGVSCLYGLKVPDVPRGFLSESKDYDLAVTIRTATTADAAVVADLARRTFYDTFAATNNPTDMALYLQGAYGVDQQTLELERS